MVNRIEFFEPEDAYGWLVALSPHPIEVAGVTWPTAENYYQAQKFQDADKQEQIRAMPDPRAAKAKSREFSALHLDRPDWDEIKVDVMMEIQRIKFAQHPDLTQLLLETTPAELVEVSPTDTYWGWNPDHGGENVFGKLMMRLRDELQA